MRQPRHVCSLTLHDQEHFLLCIAKIWGAHVHIKMIMTQRQTWSSEHVLQSISTHITLLNPIAAANAVTVR